MYYYQYLKLVDFGIIYICIADPKCLQHLHFLLSSCTEFSVMFNSSEYQFEEGDNHSQVCIEGSNGVAKAATVIVNSVNGSAIGLCILKLSALIYHIIFAQKIWTLNPSMTWQWSLSPQSLL